MLIYVMGDARSGSTPLGIILGSHSTIECVGELFRWPQFRGQTKPGDEREEHRAFWEAVRNAYLARAGPPDYSHIAAVQEKFESYMNFPKVVLGLYDSGDMLVYCSHMERLLQAVRSVSGAEIIADTSKRMGRAWMLPRCLKEEVRIIHLVRDPRGTLWSFMKRGIEQKAKSPVRTLLHYSVKNAMSSVVRLGLPNNSTLRVRYEDLVQAPTTELLRIGNFLGLDFSQTVRELEERQPIPVPFLLDGNRIRKSSTIQIRPDEEWRTGMAPTLGALAIGLTVPFSLAYGYFGSADK